MQKLARNNIIKDGVIYYSGEVEFESSQLGEIKLCSVNIDGESAEILFEY